MLRECLAIREKQMPNDFRAFNARALVGQALLLQQKYAEAEPLLLEGYEGLRQRQAQIPQPPSSVRPTSRSGWRNSTTPGASWSRRRNGGRSGRSEGHRPATRPPTGTESGTLAGSTDEGPNAY